MLLRRDQRASRRRSTRRCWSAGRNTGS